MRRRRAGYPRQFVSDLPTAVTGSTGLTAAEVAERVAAGQVNLVDERTSRPLTRSSGPTSSPASTPSSACCSSPSIRGRLAGRRAVRPRPGRNALDRDRAGVPGQAHARPARGAQRPDGRPSCATATRAGDRGRRGRARRPGRLRTGDQVPADGVVATRTGWRSTSRSSPASPTRSTRRPATRCSPAAIVVAGAGPFQATAVGRRRLRPPARRRGQAVHHDPLGAHGRHQHRSCATSPGR